MGDRGNIVVLDEFGPGDVRYVYLYTHWRGSEIRELLQEALAKRWRWDDGPYLTRIIFDTLKAGDEGSKETGYGISAGPGDNSHPILVVDPRRQHVLIVEDEDVLSKAVQERVAVPQDGIEAVSFEQWAQGNYPKEA